MQPNIITIHEIGEAGSTHYIVTEYVEGETLRRRMASAPQKEVKPRIEASEAIDIALQIAAALYVAGAGAGGEGGCADGHLLPHHETHSGQKLS